MVAALCILLIAVLFGGGEGDTGTSDASQTIAGATRPAVERAKRQRRRRPQLGDDSKGFADLDEPNAVDADDVLVVPEGSVAVRELSVDELRAEQGLPRFNPGIASLADYPLETREESADPDRHQLYALHRDLYKAGIMAEYEALEAQRFERDADDPAVTAERAAMLRRAAVQHRALGLKYAESAATLERTRKQTLAMLQDQADTDPISPDSDH